MRSERAAREFETDPVGPTCKRLHTAIQSLDSAWSGSCLGYHASVYTEGLRPKRGGEEFDREWGFRNGIYKPWTEYDYESIRAEIHQRADVWDLSPIEQARLSAQEAFELSQSELLPTLDALLTVRPDSIIQELRQKIADLGHYISRAKFASARLPKGQVLSRDSFAVAQGLQVPLHVNFQAWLMEQQSYGTQNKELAKFARHAERYLRQTLKMKGQTVAKTSGKVFIGHGRSHLWRELLDFIQNRLGLEPDEFNRESVAGLTTKERLKAMLDNACFAFLIMTAEDEHTDTTMHARENVIHEVGLFQGRLTFERAIILLEEGCAEFSNIHGVQQIRFPEGNIKAAFEDIRQVLEREEIL